MSVFSLILIALFGANSFSNTGDQLGRSGLFHTCDSELNQNHHILRTVTFRDDEYTMGILAATAGLPGAEGGTSPEVDFEQVLSGQKSVLSLGEGDSTLIRHLNIASLEASGVTPHHAVDVAFNRSAAILINRRSMLEFPENYHSQTYQDRRLGTPGLHWTFDEIVSSHALSYVLAKQLKPQDYVGRASAKNMMLRILSHLNPGGVLRSWGLWSPNLDNLSELLQSLKDEGLISDYGFDIRVTYAGYEERVLWLQKADRPCGYICGSSS